MYVQKCTTTKKHEARGYDMKKKKIVMFGSYVADLTGIAEHLPKAAETVFGDELKLDRAERGVTRRLRRIAQVRILRL